MKSFFSILASCFALLVSCDEAIQLELEQSPPKIVIDALVTDHPGYQRVKISYSNDFYDSGTTPRITDATVTVTDDLGNVFNFVHNPNDHVDSAGIYVPQPAFAGEVGRRYQLRVEIEGQVFQAEDELFDVIPIDSLGYEISEDQEDDPQEPNKIYELLLFAKEPQDEKNFYIFQFYRNDSLTYFNETDIYYSDDEFLAENIDGVASPVYYAKNDSARVEILSLSRVGYVYYDDLFSLLNNDGGGMFGPIPATPRTNITGGALGFFQVSAVKSRSVKIE